MFNFLETQKTFFSLQGRLKFAEKQKNFYLAGRPSMASSPPGNIRMREPARISFFAFLSYIVFFTSVSFAKARTFALALLSRAVLVLSFSFSVQAFDLFQEVSQQSAVGGLSNKKSGRASVGSAGERIDKLALRHRTAQINISDLQSLAVKYHSAGNLEDDINLNLFPSSEFSARVQSVREMRGGGFFIFANLKNNNTGYMTLMVDQSGAVRGEVHSVYGLFTMKNFFVNGKFSEEVLIQEIDRSQFLPLADDTVRGNILTRDQTLNTQMPANTETDECAVTGGATPPAWCKTFDNTGDNNIIDVLVVYTSGAKGSKTKEAFEADILAEIEKVNQALENSGFRGYCKEYNTDRLSCKSGKYDNTAKFNLIHAEQVSYTETGKNMEKHLFYLASKKDDEGKISDGDDADMDPDDITDTGLLEKVHDLRKQYSADLVHLVVAEPDENTNSESVTTITCGSAYTWDSRFIKDNYLSGDTSLRVAGWHFEDLKTLRHDWQREDPSHTRTSDTPSAEGTMHAKWKALGASFSVSSFDTQCKADYTFAHELGHNMGLFHDRYVEYYDYKNDANPFADPNPADPIDAAGLNAGYPLYPYGYGYVHRNSSQAVCWNSIMAYSNQCKLDSVTPRLGYNPVPYFSNPNVSPDLSDDNTEAPAGKSGDTFTNDLNASAAGVNAVKALENIWPNIAKLMPSENSCKNNVSIKVDDGLTPTAFESCRNEKSYVEERRRSSCTGYKPQLDALRFQDTSNGKQLVEYTNLIKNIKLFFPQEGVQNIELPISDFPRYCRSNNALSATAKFKEGGSFFTSEVISPPGQNPRIRIGVPGNTTCELKEGSITVQGLGLETPEDEDDDSDKGSLIIQIKQAADTNRQTRNIIARVIKEDPNLVCNDENNRINPAQVPETLNLESTGITGIQSTDFAGLQKVKNLNLSRNQITELPLRVFSSLSNLEELDVSDNNISELPNGVFRGYNSLKRVNLSRNGLTLTHHHIRRNTSPFSGASSVRSLDLSHNAINELKEQNQPQRSYFSGLANLRYLYLNNNRISSLNNTPFSLLRSLRSLDLSNNNITELASDSFSGLSKLRYLSLSGNPIRTLPINIADDIPRLRYLNLSGNSFPSSGYTFSSSVCTSLNSVYYIVLNEGQSMDRFCPNNNNQPARVLSKSTRHVAEGATQTAGSFSQSAFHKISGRPHFINSRYRENNNSANNTALFLNFLLSEERELVSRLKQAGVSSQHILSLINQP